MSGIFAVFRTHGEAWSAGRPLEEQALWTEHATFMDRLADEGFALLVGPLEGTDDALLIVRASDPDEVHRRLADDPWTSSKHLYTSRLAPWTLRIGAIPQPSLGTV